MKISTLLFLCILSTIAAQEKPITFKIAKQQEALVFTCTNTSKVTQEVTLTLTKKKGLEGYTRPIIKKVSPNTMMEFAVFPITGAYSYSYKTAWKENRTTQEQATITAAKKEKLLKDLSKINTGIVVFDNSDCPRCQRSTSYLLDNNIDFKLLNVTDNKENNRLMWDLLKAEGVEGTILTPVFLVDGKLSWSHEDLKGFLKGLKSRG